MRPVDILAARIQDPRELDPALHLEIDSVLQFSRKALAENRTLAATRDALLPQLVSGKLRVRDAETIAADAGV